MSGPLAGVRVLEMEAIGPVPWAGMMLAGMGASVIRVARPAACTEAGLPSVSMAASAAAFSSGRIGAVAL